MTNLENLDQILGLNNGKKLLFIDASLPNLQQFIKGANDDVHIELVHPFDNGFDKITETLGKYNNVSEIHVFSHGAENLIKLGNADISKDDVFQYADAMLGWRQHLAPGADILFYGCNIAGNEEGQTLIDLISGFSGADVAASDDVTGHYSLAGDWDLEYQTGKIEAQLPIAHIITSVWSHIMAAMPTVALDDLSGLLVGGSTSFKINFSNASAEDTGFSPYINLFLPYLGADGVYDAETDSYTENTDGIEFIAAKIDDQGISSVTRTLVDIDPDSPGIQIEHPLAKGANGKPLVVTIDEALGLQEGDKLHVLSLPFASFAPGQPAVDIDIDVAVSNLADAGTALPIIVNSGFKLGQDGLNNYDVDPPIQETLLDNSNSVVAAAVPEFFSIKPSFLSPENKTATGENYNTGVKLAIEVAPGQTIENSNLRYVLPESVVYTGLSGGTLVGDAPLQDIAGEISDDTINISFGSLTEPQTAIINFYVDEFDQAGSRVLDETTGKSIAIFLENNMEMTGDLTPIDERDEAIAITNLYSVPSFDAHSVAVYKSSSNITDGKLNTRRHHCLHNGI